MNLRFLWLLLAAGLSHTAPAQTARIAHLSHSGSAETGRVVADNFGIIGPYFMRDSVQVLTDTTALEYGHWQGYHAAGKANKKSQIVQFSSRRGSSNYGAQRADYLRGVRISQPPVKLVGDTVPATGKTAHPQPAKTKRKKAVFLPPAPQYPGVGLALTAILLLAGAGWLLGERQPQPA